MQKNGNIFLTAIDNNQKEYKLYIKIHADLTKNIVKMRIIIIDIGDIFL